MRVAVIGAGPAGISAAMTLKQLGHAVTVFERTDAVGGKCHNLEHEGRAYDLGANLITERYTTVRPLAMSLGLGFHRFPSLQMVDLATGREPALARLGPLKRLAVRAAGRWFLRARGRTRIDDDGLAGLGPDLALPFGEWLSRHRLSGMREAFANYFIAYGYGVMDELPAAYALKFFDPVHFLSALDISLGARVPTMDQVRGGYQAIWDGVVRRDGLDVRLEAHVQRVVRDGTVTLEVRHGGEVRSHAFDRLVVACPLDSALGFLDASDEEHRLFTKIATYDYHVTAVRLVDVPRVATFLHPYAQVFTPGQPTVFYAPHAADGDDVFLFYAYGGSGVTDDYVQASIRRVVEGAPFRGRVDAVLASRTWRYFPHVDVPTMQAGFFEDVDALQGRRHTVYVGEVLTFPLVELVARHAIATVRRHLGRGGPV